MTITRSEVLANRERWIAYLREPGRKKTKGRLIDKDDFEARCCIGHACVILEIPYETKSIGLGPAERNEYEFAGQQYYAPTVLIEKLGLNDRSGIFDFDNPLFGSWCEKVNLGTSDASLANINDHTNIQPGQIADLIELFIEGGNGTPFKALDEYPE